MAYFPEDLAKLKGNLNLSRWQRAAERTGQSACHSPVAADLTPAESKKFPLPGRGTRLYTEEIGSSPFLAVATGPLAKSAAGRDRPILAAGGCRTDFCHDRPGVVRDENP
jgi:hypothetical protein